MACALFPDDIVYVLLGPKWHEAAPIFQLMSPTIFVFALINPFGTLMMATGRTVQSLKIALVIAPVVILGYWVGMRHGPVGVAAGFSIAMVVLAVPVIAWGRLGSPISVVDILKAMSVPSAASLSGAVCFWFLRAAMSSIQPVLFRLVAETAVLGGVYLLVMFFCLKQEVGYLSHLQDMGLFSGIFKTRAGKSAAEAAGRNSLG
jgi:PST family polysaccharide transporter